MMSEPGTGQSLGSFASANSSECTISSCPPKHGLRLHADLHKAKLLEQSATSQSQQYQDARHVGLMRMIFAVARRRHQKRATFQERLAESEELPKREKSQAPTLWKLRQASQILREAFRDILAAVKVCSVVETRLQTVQKAVVERNEALAHNAMVRAKMRRHLLQLSVFGIWTKQLSNAKTAESEWHKLALICRSVSDIDA